MSHGDPSGCQLGRIDSIHSREDDDQNKSPQAGAPIKRFKIKLVFQISTKPHTAVPLMNAKLSQERFWPCHKIGFPIKVMPFTEG